MNRSEQTMITVEFVLALPDRQPIETKMLPDGILLKDALDYFNLNHEAKQLINDPCYGIFNQRVEMDYPLKEGDRIEVYRPLLIDPKEARKVRAERNKTTISSDQITELR